MITSFTLPTYHNISIAFGILIFHLIMLVALPLWLLPMNLGWALLIPLFIWVHNTHWGLIHEAVHRLFSPSGNEAAGRMLSILMGASFHVLRFGHMMHHQYNRTWESEIHDSSKPLWKSRVAYYSKLLGGLYVMEVAITLVITFLLTFVIKHIIAGSLQKSFPPAADAAEQVFFRRGKIQQVRIDGALIILLYGAAFYTYGNYWPWLLLFLYSRALAVSFFDNIYHYATAPDNSEVATEFSMPRFVSAALLYSNYHETHHLKPNIPWRFLPDHQREGFQKNILHGARQQFYGPIFIGN